MALSSGIEWTKSTWNPLTGCTKISPGCFNCYAERMSKRLKAIGQPNYVNGFKVTMHEHALDLPLKWKRPQMIFVNSMSDLFHREVPDDFIFRVFKVMQDAPWHCFQILTKRSDRLLELSSQLPWQPHIWMGVSIENEDYAYRLDHLRNTAARVKFLSIEPLLGPLPGIGLHGMDWVIVGGESGPRARVMHELWVKDIRDKCIEANVPFFFKQWGGVNRKRTGRLLEGRTWDGMPLLATTAKLL